MRDGAVVLSGETAAYRDEQLINAMTPVSRDHALSDTQSCGCRYRATAVRNRRTFPCCEWRILPEKALSISIWRSAPGRSSVWRDWWDPGAPNLPKPYTACVLRAPGGIWLENREISRDSTRARLASGLVYLPEDRQVSGLFLDAPVRWNTVMFNQPSWWQQGETGGGGG